MIDCLLSQQDLREGLTTAYTMNLALAMLLIEKGVITDDELDASLAKATHIVDQLVAKAKEAAES
jgi:hypothetical protein